MTEQIGNSLSVFSNHSLYNETMKSKTVIVPAHMDRTNLVLASRIAPVLPFDGETYEFIDAFSTEEELVPIRTLLGLKEQTYGDLWNAVRKQPGTHRKIISEFQKNTARRAKRAPEQIADRKNRIRIFRKRFALTKTDAEILSCLTRLAGNAFTIPLTMMNSLSACLKILGAATGLPMSEIRSALQPDGKLRMLEIVTISGGIPVICVDNEFLEYVNGVSDGRYERNLYCIDKKKVIPLDRFSVVESSKDILLSLLASNQGCQILLYGEPGTGKTELARSLARSAGLPAYFIEQGRSGEVGQRKAALVVTSSVVGQSGILIADEADDLLNLNRFGDGMQKAWINTFFDRSECRMIWITNHIDSMDDSLRRRFDFSVCFPSLGSTERVRFWSSILATSPIRRQIPGDFVERASSHYPVNPAGVVRALACAERMPNLPAQRVVETVLSSHTELMHGRRPGPLPTSTTQFDRESLHTDRRVEALPETLRRFVDQPEKSYAMTLLFWGTPGTGKTEFARELARMTSIPLTEKRASDLLNPFLGLTEKAIRRAFSEAEDKRSLLLFDEADSLLTDRRGARHSWERTMTNEFLASLERFRGIFVATTNFLETLDPACLRRFSWKVEFRPLTQEGKGRLFARYFPSCILTPSDVKVLRAIEPLTAGDYRAAEIRMAGRNSLTTAEALDELAAESAYKEENRSRPIGFRGSES